MHVVLILMVFLALYQLVPQPAEPVDATAATLLMLLGQVLVAITAYLPSRFLVQRLWRQPHRRPKLVRLYHQSRLLHLGLTVAVYVYTLFDIHWGTVVRINWGLKDAVLLDEVLVLAPFLLSVVLGWSGFYRVERALHETSSAAFERPFWSWGEYLTFQARQYLGLILVPVFLFFGIYELLGLLLPDLAKKSEIVQFLTMMGTGAVVLLAMPWLITRIWSTESLPAGPLRTQLEGAARRAGFRYTDIRLWHTHGCMANAMVTGFLRVPRYVLLSDMLVEHLTPEEIEAVFGHEMGHVRHRHMPLYLTFLGLSMAALAMGSDAITKRLPAEVQTVLQTDLNLGALTWHFFAALGGATAVVGGYFWLVFGFLSRRCERQADVFACKAISGPEYVLTGPETNGHATLAAEPPAGTLRPHGIHVFIAALEKVADLNGIRRDKHGWRHGSIARRIRFLEGLLADPQAEPRFQRELVLFKLGLLACLVGVIAVLWWTGAGA